MGIEIKAFTSYKLGNKNNEIFVFYNVRSMYNQKI